MPFLWKVNSQAVLEAMERAGIETAQCLAEKAHLNKSTMTKVLRDMLVRQKTLESVADVLGVPWKTLQVGHFFYKPGRSDKKRHSDDDAPCEVVDVLTAFAALAAYRTGVTPEEVRCLAYLFDKKKSCLGRLSAFTGGRTVDDQAKRIPCSGKPEHLEEEDWYIISRAFRKNEYSCEDVDWQLAVERGFVTAETIWEKLRGVAAQPIRPRVGNVVPTGVVCVDTAKSARSIGWCGNDNLQKLMESLGGILYVMVKARTL